MKQKIRLNKNDISIIRNIVKHEKLSPKVKNKNSLKILKQDYGDDT